MEQLKDIVFPGDIIAKEEEYVSGKNTQDIDGDESEIAIAVALSE